jgi:hypothetical protein
MTIAKRAGKTMRKPEIYEIKPQTRGEAGCKKLLKGIKNPKKTFSLEDFCDAKFLLGTDSSDAYKLFPTWVNTTIQSVLYASFPYRVWEALYAVFTEDDRIATGRPLPAIDQALQAIEKVMYSTFSTHAGYNHE